METALLLPVLVLLAFLVVVGAEILRTQIGITDAARAGAVAAAAAAIRGTPPLAAADSAAASEGIHLLCSGTGVPASCVSVTTATGAQSGITMEVVDVYDSVVPWWPFGGAITVHAEAAAAL